MDYNLEALGPERFQNLCQALLTASFPNVQCLPVAQPDGGRDAFVKQDGGFIVFQVKYARDPSAKGERTSISDLIASEKAKVKRLINKGAASYYLMTNVGGTAHLDRGSIDRVNEELANAFGIPSYCFWRSDIERRIESTSGLIWRYPEIFRGSDFLEILSSNRSAPVQKTKENTFRYYVAAQYSKESEVRFQQVQIQNSLLDLFTDTPIGIARDKVPSRETANVSAEFYGELGGTTQQHRYNDLYGDSSTLLAADCLLRAAPEEGLQRIVLEGAPGQGKSTVTQYVAQLQRMRSLRKQGDAAKVPRAHLDHLVRLPLRVDLRDYATWLTGSDPFAPEKDVRRPEWGTDSLESFLTYQIHTLSGGRDFKLEDLSDTLEDSHALLVLDGFDEVADKSTRLKLIEQIRSASERMGACCKSVQVIVTSRPAAFILSSGFPEREWLHLSLLPMKLSQISEYTDKWILARSFPASEGRDFKLLLLDRVSRSHIRSLAQNPMQLAILLTLISTKGRSLPDKRTALYDSYMDLFFGREAEKDETVRENRDLLVQIHQYVAWTLQIDAEQPGGSGSITQSDLEALVRAFLVEKEHTGDVLKLFTGAVERVGALVSRVQGMLEFEVQPLREYFTGKFLYETAPYSPPGAEKGGTRPQRFDALARRPYWLNVTRFYAGCYNSGELASLVSGLEVLQEDAPLALQSHALQLAVLFLADWVFSQEPKTVRDVVDFLVADDSSLRVLLSSRESWEDARLTFPEKSGRKEICVRLREKFLLSQDDDLLSRIGLVLRWNMPSDERWTLWREVSEERHGYKEACTLGLFEEADEGQKRELLDKYGDGALEGLINFGQWETLSTEERVRALSCFASKPPRFLAHRRDGRGVVSDAELYRVYVMLNPFVYAYLHYSSSRDATFEESISSYGFFPPPGGGRLVTGQQEESGLFDVINAAARAARASVDEWATSPAPWSDFIEAARRTWGDDVRMYSLAAIAAGIKAKDAKAAGFGDILDSGLPLVERARHARLRPTAAWWRASLRGAKDTNERLWVLILMLSWAPANVWKSMASETGKVIESLPSEHWVDLMLGVRAVISATRQRRAPLSGLDESTLGKITSHRLRALLMLRLPKALAQKTLSDLLRNYDGGDLELGSFLSARGFNEAHDEAKLWKDVIAFYRRCGSQTAAVNFDRSFQYDRIFFHRGAEMPASVAQLITEDVGALPLRVLEAAQISPSVRESLASTPLGTVAGEEQWF
jgi:hypothetical protein